MAASFACGNPRRRSTGSAASRTSPPAPPELHGASEKSQPGRAGRRRSGSNHQHERAMPSPSRNPGASEGSWRSPKPNGSRSDGTTSACVLQGCSTLRAALVKHREGGFRFPSHYVIKTGPFSIALVGHAQDRELERRGLQFVRYADDCNIYVRSERAGHRVMASVTRFLTSRLKLKVNQAKSAVARPWFRKFLGFSFTYGKEMRRRVAPQALDRFRERVRSLTRRTRSVSLQQMTDDLSRYLAGWRGYFSFASTPSVFRNLDSWIRRRLRSAVWKQWKRGKVRFAELVKRGVSRDLAATTAGSAHGPWRISASPALSVALPNVYLASLGLPSLGAPPTLAGRRA